MAHGISVSRRGFLAGLTAAIAAPAIVKATSLMPIKVVKPTMQDLVVYGRSPAMDALPSLEFLEGMSQRMAMTLFYGNPDATPLEFSGFMSMLPAGST